MSLSETKRGNDQAAAGWFANAMKSPEDRSGKAEELLVLRAQLGDKDALEQLFRAISAQRSRSQ
jgi:hypothetical protein